MIHSIYLVVCVVITAEPLLAASVWNRSRPGETPRPRLSLLDALVMARLNFGAIVGAGADVILRLLTLAVAGGVAKLCWGG